MTLDSAIGVISRWGSTATGRKSYVFDGTRDEIDQYLQAVDEIQHHMNSASRTGDASKAKSAINVVKLQLTDEVHNILKVNAKSTGNPDSGTYSSTMTDSASNSYEVHEDDYVYSNTITAEAIDDLRSITVRMNSAGFLNDCKDAYITERKRRVSASIQRLSVQKLNKNRAQTSDWKALESIIRVWIKSVRICFLKIFTYEKQLCQKIFQGLGTNTDDDCFLEIVKDQAVQLLETAESLSCIHKASERLFGVLELHKTLFGLSPQINQLFPMESFKSFRTSTGQILQKLLVVSMEILSGFEKAVLTDQSPPGRFDQIHSLAKYVMTYVFKLCQQEQTLLGLPLPRLPSTAGAGISFNVEEFEGQSQLSIHVVWIIMCLLSKLEWKAKQCVDASAGHFFVMNNVNYVFQKIEGKPDVREMIGDYYFKKLIQKLDQAKGKYLKSTFGKVLHCLRDEGLDKRGLMSSRSSKVKDRLKSFNAEFLKLRKDLKTLAVPFQLLQDLRNSVKEMLLPAYTSFLGHLTSQPHLQIKYTAEGLEAAILEFFIGTQNQ